MKKTIKKVQCFFLCCYFFLFSFIVLIGDVMRVNSLCRHLNLNYVTNNHFISGITDDSRYCINNSIFVAIKGNRIDGNKKIDEAIKNGAKTIFIEKEVIKRDDINYIYVENCKRTYALMLSVYYKKIMKKIKIIGVIGTNGKTTTSTLIYKYLLSNNKKVMLIGSNGAYCRDYYRKHENTTPGITELYNYFLYADDEKIDYLVMEVSSISISELRIFGIDFDTLIFTNFSEDHLDYHKSMDLYFFDKSIPFIKLTKKNNAIINVDDDKGRNIIKYCNAKVFSYGFNSSRYKIKNLVESENGISFNVNGIDYKSNLIGEFNAYNILPLFAIRDIYKFKKSLNEFLLEFSFVEGRMNRIDVAYGNVIIDYAHTPCAVLKAISAVSKICKGDLYVIVGCGGNREKEKRKKIGEILSNNKCIPIITSDNPRFENPTTIINEIIAGMTIKPISFIDRKEAILYALNQMKINDYVLILGKGCENYLDIRGIKEKYSDYEVVENWIYKTGE